MANFIQAIIDLARGFSIPENVDVEKADNFWSLSIFHSQVYFFDFINSLSPKISLTELEVYLFCLEAKLSSERLFTTKKDIQKYVMKKHLGRKYNGEKQDPESYEAKFCKRENAFWNSAESPINRLFTEGLLIKEKKKITAKEPENIDLTIFKFLLTIYIYQDSEHIKQDSFEDIEIISKEDQVLYESYLKGDETNSKQIESKIDQRTIQILNDIGLDKTALLNTLKSEELKK